LEFAAEEEKREQIDIIKSKFQNIVGIEPRIVCSIEESKRILQGIDIEVEKCRSL
jgi:hypothetical protein